MVERVVPNALFDRAIRKSLGDKPLGKLGALSLSNGSLHLRCRAKSPTAVPQQCSEVPSRATV
jgi:hypothetical protein